MNYDQWFNDENFPRDYSPEDWNRCILERFSPFFRSYETILVNREMLRVELVNLIRLEQKPEHYGSLVHIHQFYSEVVKTHREKALHVMNEMLEENNKTDNFWTTLVNSQINPESLEPRDKIAYYFEKIDQISEGALRPRLAHLFRFAGGAMDGIFKPLGKMTLGSLVDRFPENTIQKFPEFLSDPKFKIKISQWRNIGSHKSFTVSRRSVLVKHGTDNQYSVEMSHDDVEVTLQWVLDTYAAIRLAQVLIYFEVIPEMFSKHDLLISNEMRFDSRIFGIIHNMSLVGFQYSGVVDEDNSYTVCFFQNINEDMKTSLIHASQALDQIASATDLDPMTHGKYASVAVRIDSRENKKPFGLASVAVEVALRKIRSEIDLRTYVNNINFRFYELHISILER